MGYKIWRKAIDQRKARLREARVELVTSGPLGVAAALIAYSGIEAATASVPLALATAVVALIPAAGYLAWSAAGTVAPAHRRGLTAGIVGGALLVSGLILAPNFVGLLSSPSTGKEDLD